VKALQSLKKASESSADESPVRFGAASAATDPLEDSVWTYSQALCVVGSARSNDLLVPGMQSSTRGRARGTKKSVQEECRM
jgi:hypothetical protein